jgi:hypothetical protein
MLGAEIPQLVFKSGATMPIVDWEAMRALAPVSLDKAALGSFWTTIARGWLEALRAALGPRYVLRESDHFLMFGSLDDPGAKVALDFVERARRAILEILDGVALGQSTGKVCLLVFEDQDRYYQYVSNYYEKDGEYALSGGMFLQRGYGHFAFVASEIDAMEPTIAHELTHCLLQHLPLPAWLNEGTAVNTERRLCPPSGRPLYTAEEMQERHLKFWDEATIQEFWSGKSWLRPDEGNELSYDLARNFALLACEDFGAFRGFANAADAADAGNAAALKHLGYPVANLAEAVLGEGPWEPRPELWKEGVERGQFGWRV